MGGIWEGRGVVKKQGAGCAYSMLRVFLQLRGVVTGVRTQLFGYRHEYLVQCYWVMKQWRGACASVGIAASCYADNINEAKKFASCCREYWVQLWWGLWRCNARCARACLTIILAVEAATVAPQTASSQPITSQWFLCRGLRKKLGHFMFRSDPVNPLICALPSVSLCRNVMSRLAKREAGSPPPPPPPPPPFFLFFFFSF